MTEKDNEPLPPDPDSDYDPELDDPEDNTTGYENDADALGEQGEE
jgi:hypothetical protein